MLVKLLKDNGFDNASRGFTYFHQSDLIGLPGIHVECKNAEKLSIRKAMQQAEEEAEKRKDGAPTVFWKSSRKPWLTIMRTEDWITLYKMAIGKEDHE